MSVGSSGDKGRQPPPDAEVDERYGMVLSERYRIGELLGTGGMGRVYAAEHVLMRKKLAVKVLHKELSLVPEVVTRFKREAMAAANIDHPNVAAATDFGKLDDGSVFLVLEHVQGLSMREIINAGPVAQARVLHIARQIASALASAHALDIVHRDLKPENVMLVKKGYDPDFVKVLDFGIAKVPIQELSERGSLRPGQAITKIGMVFGTPEYMAPEQALGQPVDGRADLYALGVMMFEMLAGVRPYASSSQVGMLGQQLSMPVPCVVERAPGVEVSPLLEELLQELLNKESTLRPATAKDVVERLDQMIRASRRAPGVRPVARVEPSLGAVSGRSVASLLGTSARRGRVGGGGSAPLPPPRAGVPRSVVAPPPSRRPPPQTKEAEPPLAARPIPPRLDASPVPPPAFPMAVKVRAQVELDEPATVELPVVVRSEVPDDGASTNPSAEVQDAGPIDGVAASLDESSPTRVATSIERSAATGARKVVSGVARHTLRRGLDAWERGVARVETSRTTWPRFLRDALIGVPPAAILGGLSAVLAAGALGGVTLLVASRDVDGDPPPFDGTTPAASAQLLRSGVPSPPRPERSAGANSPREIRVSERELVLAKQQGAAALEQLARQFPEDPAISVELAKAYRLEKRYPEVISQIRRLLELDPTMSRDAEIATLLWQSAQKQDSRDAAFALLEGPMGSRGADILFDLASTRGIRADVKALAERYFDSSVFSHVASEALKVAVALKEAKSCGEKMALLARAERAGDRRALSFLRPLESATGCGPRGKVDCFPCLRDNERLAKAIQAIDARTRK